MYCPHITDSTASPSAAPTASPSAAPTASPSADPTASPSADPSASPSQSPTAGTREFGVIYLFGEIMFFGNESICAAVTIDT